MSPHPQAEPQEPRVPDTNHSSRRALTFAVTTLLIGALLVTLGPEPLAPLAGPWAARLVNHSCGLIDHLPLPSYLLALAAPPAIYLATRTHLSRLRLIPATLWTLTWLLAGLASFVNTLE